MHGSLILVCNQNRCGPIAQLEEPPAHNRSVPGSNPGGPINYQKTSAIEGRAMKGAPFDFQSKGYALWFSKGYALWFSKGYAL